MATVTAGVAFAAYVATLQPGFGGPGDSRIFQLLASVPGTSHAPGYPLYQMLLDLGGRLAPWIDGAVRTNLLSALAAGAAVGILVLVLRQLDVGPTVAAAVSLAFAFTRAWWSQSVVAEVYTLNVLFLLLVIWNLLEWQRRGRRRSLAFAMVAFFLGVGHHTTLVVMAPAVVVFLWRVDRRALRSPWFIAVLAGAAVIGLAPFALVVARTFDPQAVHLGASAGTVGQLIDTLLGGSNRVNLFRQPLAAVLLVRLPRMAWTVLTQLHVLLPFAVLGAWRKPAARDLLLLMTIAGVLAFVAFYTVPDLKVFYLPAYPLCAAFAGVGLERTLRALPSSARLRAAAAVLPVTFFVADFGFAAGLRDTTTLPWATSTLRAAPRPAVVIALHYDVFVALRFAELSELPAGPRQRVVFYPSPALGSPIGFEQVRRSRCDGVPMRLGMRGHTIAVDRPLYVADRRPAVLERLRTRGYALQAVAPGLWRITGADCSAPRLPAAILVTEERRCATRKAAVDAVLDPAFDPALRAVVLGLPPGIQRLSEQGGGRVDIVRWSSDEIVVDVGSPGPAWLVITDAVPPYWWAWVDGRGTGTHAVNVLHRGLEVSAGHHRIVLRDPAGHFRLGAWLTGTPPDLPSRADSHLALRTAQIPP